MGAPAYWGCPLRDAPFSCRSATERDYGVLHKDHPSGVYAWLIPILQYRYGAGHASFPPSKERRPGLLPAVIHRSAWKGNSANFASRGFSEVRP
jgi:hypothetical protein